MTNKVCIVTGGTRGIGLSTVKAFLEEGYQVVLYGSREETVTKALNELNSEKVEGKWTSLVDEEAIKKDFAEIKEKYGSLDVLINNAGLSESTPFDKYTNDLFEKVMSLNVTAPYVCSQAAAMIMKEQGQGVILNTSSMVSRNGQPSGLAYPVSKFAINGMTISLSRELGKYNIRVNAVAPGITMTDMVKALPEQMIGPMIQAIPMKRIGEPEDIAKAFVFLASDNASYITGAILPVDGAMAVQFLKQSTTADLNWRYDPPHFAQGERPEKSIRKIRMLFISIFLNLRPRAKNDKEYYAAEFAYILYERINRQTNTENNSLKIR